MTATATYTKNLTVPARTEPGIGASNFPRVLQTLAR